MRVHLILLTISLWMALSGAAAADDARTVADLKAARLALDTAFSEQDVASIQNMVTPDHVGVTSYYRGSFSAEKEIETLSELKTRYFDFSETRVELLGEDAAMVTFENSQSGTYAGKPLPSRIAVVEIWTRSSGKWLQKYYQETPIGD